MLGYIYCLISKIWSFLPNIKVMLSNEKDIVLFRTKVESLHDTLVQWDTSEKQ